MNCFFFSKKHPLLIYESAQDDCDKEFMVLWKKFLNGECPSWLELVADGVTGTRPPSVYFHDIFKEMIHNNLRTQRPMIAEELNSRSFKCTMRIFVNIMKFTLENVLEEQEDREEPIGKSEKAKKMEAKSQYINKIAKYHCKWHVDDASYITIENALMESLRVCLGTDFTATFEVRMRYKYGQVKNLIMSRQGKFEQSCPFEASKLREEGKIRIAELQAILASRERERRPSRELEAENHRNRLSSEKRFTSTSSLPTFKSMRAFQSVYAAAKTGPTFKGVSAATGSVYTIESVKPPETMGSTVPPPESVTTTDPPNGSEPAKEAACNGSMGHLGHAPPSKNQRTVPPDTISEASEQSTCSTTDHDL